MNTEKRRAEAQGMSKASGEHRKRGEVPQGAAHPVAAPQATARTTTGTMKTAATQFSPSESAQLKAPHSGRLHESAQLKSFHNERHHNTMPPDRPDHTLGPLPPDSRESLRGWLGSIIMAIIAVVVVAALTWGVLNWREAQVQQEAAQAAPQEQPARLK